MEIIRGAQTFAYDCIRSDIRSDIQVTVTLDKTAQIRLNSGTMSSPHYCLRPFDCLRPKQMAYLWTRSSYRLGTKTSVFPVVELGRLEKGCKSTGVSVSGDRGHAIILKINFLCKFSKLQVFNSFVLI